MSIKENISRIKETIGSKSKSPGNVVLIAVTKTVDEQRIREAYDCGIRDFGENRVQEAAPKINGLKGLDITWHLIGHLQSNKAKTAVSNFSLIHSADKISTLKEIDSCALKIGKTQDVLIEVNTSGEETKFGLKPEETEEFARSAMELKNINLKGLMTIGPLTGNKSNIADSFKKLYNIRENLKMLYPDKEWKYLSMGMTDDYEIALEYGANMLRIGRGIFGND